MANEKAAEGQPVPMESAMRTEQGDENDPSDAVTIGEKLTDADLEDAPTNTEEAAAAIGAPPSPKDAPAA